MPANQPAPTKTCTIGRIARIAVRLTAIPTVKVVAALGCDPGDIQVAVITGRTAKSRATAERFGLEIGGSLTLLTERSGFAGSAVDGGAECGAAVLSIEAPDDCEGDFLAGLLWAQAADAADDALLKSTADTCAAA